jgi:chorismate mutase
LMLIPIRGTRIVGDLRRSNPILRDLNRWFTSYVRQSGIECVVMQESRPPKIFGLRLPQMTQIVSLDSADAGVTERVIPIDADHFELCAPTHRNSLIYKTILEEICHGENAPNGRALQVAQISETRSIVENIRTETSQLREAVQKSTTQLVAQMTRTFDPGVVNTESETRISALRKIRMFPEVDVATKANQLSRDFLTGELFGASIGVKVFGLGWCARIMSAKNPQKAREFLDAATSLGSDEITKIADACIATHTGDTEHGLARLESIGGVTARSAALLAVLAKDGFRAALNWIHQAALSIADLDPDGKYAYLVALISAGRWGDAIALDDTISDEDRKITPALLLMSANLHMALSFADEFRFEILEHGPLASVTIDAAADAGSSDHRRTSIKNFRTFADTATSLGADRPAELAKERALWLSLLDRDLNPTALEEIRELLRGSSPSMRLLSLALQFDKSIDLALAEQAIQRVTTLSGGQSFDAALARFRLAMVQPSVTKAISYLEKHRDQLSRHLPGHIDFLIIELLASEGHTQLAKTRWESLDRSKLPQREVRILEKIIARAEAEDPLEISISSYNEHGAIEDLGKITDELTKREDWSSLSGYAKALFDRTHSMGAAETYANALFNTRDFATLRNLLSDLGEAVASSVNLSILDGWVLYYQGEMVQAKRKVDQLHAHVHDEAVWNLAVRVEIGLGDWDALQHLVDIVWSGRDNYSSALLLRAAALAASIGSGRTKVIVYEAAQKGADNPSILLSCYSLAVKAGWEQDAAVSEWFTSAVELSGDTGPVKKISMREMADQAPSWNERQRNALTHLQKAETPLSMAAISLNQSLINLYFSTALANLAESDLRKRRPIYAFGGARSWQAGASPRRIGLEATSLMTFELLEISEQVFAHFDEFVLPHTLLPWLFEEQEKIRFHQPSRVEAAKELRRLIAEGKLFEFTASLPLIPELEGQVGLELAELITQANGSEETGGQNFVIHSYPVHRLGSFMEEVVDLTHFSGILRSSGSLVKALYDQGLLTQAEFERHQAFLAHREEAWPNEGDVAPGAILYIDGVSLSNLQQMALLSKLNAAGFKIYVGGGAVEEADELISYSAQQAVAAQMISSLRERLRNGIQSGRIKIHASDVTGDQISQSRFATEPTIASVGLVGHVDALVSDDRFINMPDHLDLGSGASSVLTTLDVVEILHGSQIVDTRARDHCRTRARQLGFLFCPVDAQELYRFLSACEVRDSAVVERAELKAVRESILLSRLSEALLVPQELIWLQKLQETAIAAIKRIWRTDGATDATRARSVWLLAIMDIRGWSHRLPPGSSTNDWYLQQLLSVALSGLAMGESVRPEFNRWCDGTVLSGVAAYDREALKRLAERAALGIKIAAAKQFGGKPQ